MKKLMAVLLSAAMLVGTVFAFTGCDEGGGDGKTLYVYTNAGFAPYEYVDGNGNVVGVDMEIMKEVGSVLGYEVIINDIEFNQILEEVSKNEFAVGAAGMTKKGDRDKVALASDIYATSIQYVIAPNGAFEEGAKVTVDQIATYVDSKSIGVQKGTTGADMVESDYEDKTVEYTNAIVASEDIGTTLGAVVIDKLPAESISGNNRALSCWEIDAEPESYVFYFNQNAGELVEKVNQVLKVMIEDGVIDYYTLKHTGGIIK